MQLYGSEEKVTEVMNLLLQPCTGRRKRLLLSRMRLNWGYGHIFLIFLTVYPVAFVAAAGMHLEGPGRATVPSDGGVLG